MPLVGTGQYRPRYEVEIVECDIARLVNTFEVVGTSSEVSIVTQLMEKGRI